MNSQQKYDKKNTKKYCIKLNLRTDSDIINMLDQQKNKQGFIKSLIRKDAKNGQSGKNISIPGEIL